MVAECCIFVSKHTRAANNLTIPIHLDFRRKLIGNLSEMEWKEIKLLNRGIRRRYRECYRS